MTERWDELGEDLDNSHLPVVDMTVQRARGGKEPSPIIGRVIHASCLRCRRPLRTVPALRLCPDCSKFNSQRSRRQVDGSYTPGRQW